MSVGWIGQGRDAPACRCRDRLRALLLRRLPRPPAAQQETGDAPLLCRQLQAARGVERQRSDLSHHCAQGSTAQGFLEGPAHLPIAPGGNEQQPPQIEAVRGKAGCIEVVILGDPGDPPCRGIGQGAGEETGTSRALLFIAGMAGNFMDSAERNGGFPQVGIDGCHAGGKHGRRA